MKYLSLFKSAINCCLIFVFALALLGSAYSLLASEPYVLLTLKDKTTEKFEYDSFELSWILSQIKEEFTCEAFDIDVENVVDIYVLTLKENTCKEDEYKEDWLFDVHFSNRRAIQGFIELYEPKVSGKSFNKKETKSIPYKEIKKISFFR